MVVRALLPPHPTIRPAGVPLRLAPLTDVVPTAQSPHSKRRRRPAISRNYLLRSSRHLGVAPADDRRQTEATHMHHNFRRKDHRRVWRHRENLRRSHGCASTVSARSRGGHKDTRLSGRVDSVFCAFFIRDHVGRADGWARAYLHHTIGDRRHCPRIGLYWAGGDPKEKQA